MRGGTVPLSALRAVAAAATPPPPPGSPWVFFLPGDRRSPGIAGEDDYISVRPGRVQSSHARPYRRIQSDGKGRIQYS